MRNAAQWKQTHRFLRYRSDLCCGSTPKESAEHVRWAMGQALEGAVESRQEKPQFSEMCLACLAGQTESRLMDWVLAPTSTSGKEIPRVPYNTDEGLKRK